jgi:hypothetical protein
MNGTDTLSAAELSITTPFDNDYDALRSAGQAFSASWRATWPAVGTIPSAGPRRDLSRLMRVERPDCFAASEIA